MSRISDKRSRLVLAADQLFHEKGVSVTTLANIAQLGDVPLGNVYYYFKSKESIVVAVIEYRNKILQQQFEELNSLSDAKSRLAALIRQSITGESVVKFGDALGSLCHELGKQGGEISSVASNLMQQVIDWCENQFMSLGKSVDTSKKLAQSLVSSLQGVSLLALTFKSEEFQNQQAEYLVNWLETV